jgi:dienelactone hydrolase
MGLPAWRGPDVGSGGTVDAVGVVAVVVEPAAVVVVVDERPGPAEGLDGPLLQAASTIAPASTAAAPVYGRRRIRIPRMAKSMASAFARVRSPPMANTRDISYDVDGRTMVGTLALPEGSDRRPGVLVCHEGPGLDDHARSRAARLADERGYVAFALDYHGGGRPVENRDEMMGRIGELRADLARTRAIGQAGLDVLCAEDRTDANRLAAIGYCFGGTLSFELARGGADLKAAVGFHAGLSTVQPEDARAIRGKILALIGADDPIVPPEQRRAFEEEMTAGGVDWQLVVYGGAVHSFTNPRAANVDLPGIAYHEPTDRRSWQAMCDLFDEVLV